MPVESGSVAAASVGAVAWGGARRGSLLAKVQRTMAQNIGRLVPVPCQCGTAERKCVWVRGGSLLALLWLARACSGVLLLRCSL